MAETTDEANAIADCVLDAFHALPPHRKPRLPSSGLKPGCREWVPLAGIVVDSGNNDPPSKRLKCAAFATGMKCLPQEKMSALQGNVIHDSHAEILALRAFNRFLLDQCADLAAKRVDPDNKGDQANQLADNILEWREDQSRFTNLWQAQPFRIKSAIKLHMYCSEAPCGDASMELTMAAQQDATPWSHAPSPGFDPSSGLGPEKGSNSGNAPPELYGRSYFDALGVVRRKPSRPDAPPTLSKSCSDKIALKQSTSILSSITSFFVHSANAYIHTLVLPSSQYIDAACQRAFGPEGRMAPLVLAWDHNLSQAGYNYRPFKVNPTRRDFDFSRRAAPSTADAISVIPSNISSLMYGSNQETLINGVLQGRKQCDKRGASAVSRRKSWALALSIATLIEEPMIHQALSRSTYHKVKGTEPLRARNLSKKLTRQGPLSGWKRNSGDDEWSL